MPVYDYDGTWRGFSSVLERVFRNTGDFEIRGPGSGMDLFEDRIRVPSDGSPFLGDLLITLNAAIARTVTYAFASVPCIDTEIALYLKLVAEKGMAAAAAYTNPGVMAVDRAGQRVGREIGKFLGILRFTRSPDGVYRAVIGPDNDILSFIAPHFRERFRDQRWIIADEKRRVSAEWNLETLSFRRALPADLPSPCSADEVVSSWQDYYRIVSVEGRENPKQQKRLLPVRYWKNLVEKPGDGLTR